MREIIVDSFAGGGGASLGIELALGVSPDVAINHDAEALAMHAVNHPRTLHLNSNVWKIDPDLVEPGRAIGLMWASPDCKHHSKAKGGKPLSRNVRDLAWVAVLWARRRRPRVICLENVEEFRDWGPLGADDRPVVARRGETFARWVGQLRKLGYRVEHRELRACDYGAPTIRKRLFLVARRDGAPIVWPAPTHGDPKSEAVRAGRLPPWRTAAEIIDWSLPCRSIFLTREEGRALGVNRPLAEATMARIAKGVKRYVIDAAEPFIVPTGGQSVSGSRQSGDVAGPFVAPVTHSGDSRVHGIGEPLRTVTTAHRGEHALVTPIIAGCGGRAGQSRPRSAGEPLATMTAKADAILVAPYLVPRYGEREGQEPRARSIEEPIATVVPTGNGASLVAAHLSRQFGASVGSGVESPIGTVTAGGGGKTAVVAAHLTKFQTGSVGSDLRAPAPTVTANSFIKRPGAAAPIGVVAAHLSAYYGNGDGGQDRTAPADGPVRTVTTENRHAVVAAFLAQHNADRPGHSADEPVSTIMSDGVRQAVTAAFLAQQNGGMVGHEAGEPVSTISQKGAQQQVVTAQLEGVGPPERARGPLDSRVRGNDRVGSDEVEVSAGLLSMRGSDQRSRGIDEPHPTVTAQGTHSAEVRAFLIKYYGSEGQAQTPGDPLHTVPTKPRFGLVTVAGEPYEIVDIGMRMLRPRELFRAQGFPDSYVIDRRPDGSALTATAQVRMCGNSVSPVVAAALVAANYLPEIAAEPETGAALPLFAVAAE